MCPRCKERPKDIRHYAMAYCTPCNNKMLAESARRRKERKINRLKEVIESKDVPQQERQEARKQLKLILKRAKLPIEDLVTEEYVHRESEENIEKYKDYWKGVKRQKVAHAKPERPFGEVALSRTQDTEMKTVV